MVPEASKPAFDAAFRTQFADLIALSAYAPSVGNSQPTRFVRVASPERRAKIAASDTPKPGRVGGRRRVAPTVIER